MSAQLAKSIYLSQIGVSRWVRRDLIPQSIQLTPASSELAQAIMFALGKKAILQQDGIYYEQQVILSLVELESYIGTPLKKRALWQRIKAML